jgi:hypothetical protein
MGIAVFVVRPVVINERVINDFRQFFSFPDFSGRLNLPSVKQRPNERQKPSKRNVFF